MYFPRTECRLSARMGYMTLYVQGSPKQVLVDDWIPGFVSLESLFKTGCFPRIPTEYHYDLLDTFVRRVSSAAERSVGASPQDIVCYFGNTIFIERSLVQAFYDYVKNVYSYVNSFTCSLSVSCAPLSPRSIERTMHTHFKGFIVASLSTLSPFRV